MITAQHRNLSRPGGATMVPLHFDSALVQFRNLLAQELIKERGPNTLS